MCLPCVRLVAPSRNHSPQGSPGIVNFDLKVSESSMGGDRCGRGGKLRISVLAWGSIVWDRRNFAIIPDFEPNGPCLPIEFCRVSRDRRLTLVIEETLGAPCITYSATSAFDDLEDAIANWVIVKACQAPIGVSALPFQHATGRARRPSNVTRGQLRSSKHGPMRKALTPQSGRRLEATSRVGRGSRSRLKPRSGISKHGTERH